MVYDVCENIHRAQRRLEKGRSCVVTERRTLDYCTTDNTRTNFSPDTNMSPVRPSMILCCTVAASCLASGAVQAFNTFLPTTSTNRAASIVSSSSLHQRWCRPSRGARQMSMQLNPREEDTDFEMTVDWDEELRKLNSGELDEKLKARDREIRKMTQKSDDPADWVKAEARKAQMAAQETSYQMRGALRNAPRWQQLSRDWRFWVGVVAAVSLLLSIISASGRSQDLLVYQQSADAFANSDRAGAGVALNSLAYVALLTHATAQATGDVASQLVESGATMVFA